MNNASTRTVLIADASADNRLPLQQALSAVGFSVAEVGNGRDAIEALRRDTFDVVVTDLWMPGADGIEVIQSIRTVSPLSAIFVVTGGGPGLSIASAAALALVWGARKVYVKPFDIGELVREILALFPPLAPIDIH
ncbi:response regulator [Devosia ginsengisoli]|uniref:response regulator n=1 Tax=Devosia ginsengisoli TaxID=400770 RepID=UPI0026EB6053|nr:response regulator [Devosia ginsengisoli]MCR6673474.1 response regulator [Devosia ginsengisoli]